MQKTSNTSIIAHLESELDAYEKKERTSAEFCATLHASIEALDGVSYAKRKEIYRFCDELELAGFKKDDDRSPDRGPVIRWLRIWLGELRANTNPVVPAQ
jgi:hypothetical protein